MAIDKISEDILCVELPSAGSFISHSSSLDGEEYMITGALLFSELSSSQPVSLDGDE